MKSAAATFFRSLRSEIANKRI